MILNVYPTELRDASGKILQKDWQFKANQSLSQGIAALESLDEPNLLRIHGDCSGNGSITLGIHGNSIGGKLRQMNNTTLEGVGPDAALPSMSVFQSYPNHGNTLKGVEVKMLSANQGIIFGSGQAEVRDWTFLNCLFDGNSSIVGQAAWGGQFAGPTAGFRVLNSIFRNKREHGTYWHNASEVLIDNCLFENCARSGSQATNREWEARASYGEFRISGSKFKDCGEEGASSITFSGHTGDVILDKNDIDTVHKTGGILAYREGPKPKHGITEGAWTNENGFAFNSFKIVGRSALKMSGPPFYPIGLDSCEYTTIAPMQFLETGGKHCLELARLGQKMGEVVLGFDSGAGAVWGGNPKARWNGVEMTNEQIDALAQK